MLDFMEELSLRNVIEEYTRKNRILDLMLVNDDDSELDEVIVNSKLSDHNLMIIKQRVMNNKEIVTNV